MYFLRSLCFLCKVKCFYVQYANLYYRTIGQIHGHTIYVYFHDVQIDNLTKHILNPIKWGKYTAKRKVYCTHGQVQKKIKLYMLVWHKVLTNI